MAIINNFPGGGTDIKAYSSTQAGSGTYSMTFNTGIAFTKILSIAVTTTSFGSTGYVHEMYWASAEGDTGSIAELLTSGTGATYVGALNAFSSSFSTWASISGNNVSIHANGASEYFKSDWTYSVRIVGY